MTNKPIFLKVKSALMMKDEYVVKRNPDGSFDPSDEFSDMIIESDERFRAAVLTFIDDVVDTPWAVRFTPFTKEKYDVRIFCEEEDVNAPKIASVIRQRLPNEKWESFIYEGTVNNIGKLW